MTSPKTFVSACALMGIALCTSMAVAAPRLPMRKSVAAEGRYIAVDIVDDSVVHFEMGLEGVSRGGLAHPVSRTAALSVEVDSEAKCLITRRNECDATAVRICLQPLGHLGSQIAIDRGDTSHIYGLGEQFNEPGVTDGDYIGKWRGSSVFGNDMVAYSGSMVGYA